MPVVIEKNAALSCSMTSDLLDFKYDANTIFLHIFWESLSCVENQARKSVCEFQSRSDENNYYFNWDLPMWILAYRLSSLSLQFLKTSVVRSVLSQSWYKSLKTELLLPSKLGSRSSPKALHGSYKISSIKPNKQTYHHLWPNETHILTHDAAQNCNWHNRAHGSQHHSSKWGCKLWHRPRLYQNRDGWDCNCCPGRFTPYIARSSAVELAIWYLGSWRSFGVLAEIPRNAGSCDFATGASSFNSCYCNSDNRSSDGSKPECERNEHGEISCSCFPVPLSPGGDKSVSRNDGIRKSPGEHSSGAASKDHKYWRTRIASNADARESREKCECECNFADNSKNSRHAR